MKRKYIIAIVIFLIVACLGGGAAVYMTKVADQENYFTGIQVEGVDLSGLSKEEAQAKFDEYWNGVLATEIEFSANKKSEKITLKDLGLTYANQEVLEEAYNIGRDGNFFTNFFKIKSLEKEPQNLTLEMAFDEETLRGTLEDKTKSFEKKMKNASIKRENGEFVVTEGVDGVAINYDESIKLFTEKVTSDWADRAAFSHELVAEVTKPEYTTEMMEAVQDKLGSYSTNYSSSAWGRKRNVAKGAEYINGSVIYPGETFSVHDVVTPFTYDRGYEMAGSYLNGETVQSMGGGICQVSTTLYNAVLRAELEIVERHPHSMTVAYVPLSADAAIAGTYKDLKFKNNTDTPIYIEGYGNGYNLSFTIWGKETRASNRTIEFYTETLSSTPPKEKEEKDPTLEEGKTKIVSKGHTGYKTKLWKIVKIDGEQTEKVLVNESSYMRSTTIIAVGTKKPEVKEETTTEETTTETTTEATTETTTETTEGQE